jgi:DNA-directed RNA polymerase III subunit RPC2
VKQHIDSFNHLLNVDIQKIIASKHNRRITSDVDPTFYLQYNQIRVSKPTYKIDHEVIFPTPQECRIRDLTYAADIRFKVFILVSTLSTGTRARLFKEMMLS